MVVTLQGELGTGKTTFVRGLLRARGIRGAVKSPTYTLVEHYPISSLYFFHFDFYRFTNPNEWDSAGMPVVLLPGNHGPPAAAWAPMRRRASSLRRVGSSRMRPKTAMSIVLSKLSPVVSANGMGSWASSLK